VFNSPSAITGGKGCSFRKTARLRVLLGQAVPSAQQQRAQISSVLNFFFPPKKLNLEIYYKVHKNKKCQIFIISYSHNISCSEFPYYLSNFTQL